MSQYSKYAVYYLILINILSYILFYIDKRRAIKHKYRISEATLLLSGFLGGAPGGLLSMAVNHHKTKKWKFRILMPLFLAMWIYAIYKRQLYII